RKGSFFPPAESRSTRAETTGSRRAHSRSGGLPLDKSRLSTPARGRDEPFAPSSSLFRCHFDSFAVSSRVSICFVAEIYTKWGRWIEVGCLKNTHKHSRDPRLRDHSHDLAIRTARRLFFDCYCGYRGRTRQRAAGIQGTEISQHRSEHWRTGV